MDLFTAMLLWQLYVTSSCEVLWAEVCYESNRTMKSCKMYATWRCSAELLGAREEVIPALITDDEPIVHR